MEPSRLTDPRVPSTILASVASFPWPIRGGETLRIGSLLVGLSRRSAVHLVTPEPVDDGVVPANAGDLTLHEYTPGKLDGKEAPVTFMGKDVWPYRQDPAPLTRVLERLAGDPDLQAAAVLAWPGTELSCLDVFGERICFDLVDCWSAYALRQAWTPTRMRVRWGHIRDALVHRAYERAVLGRPEMVLVAGTSDGNAVRSLRGGRGLEVVPNGVDTDHFRPDPERRSPEPTVVFTGTLDYAPNVDALEFLIGRVWPGVVERIPGARLMVAGRNPSHRVLALGVEKGVEIVGPVRDMRDPLAESWVAVAPMISGTGVKNKVLEAWAMGLPVVMTSMARNGLESSVDRLGVVADGGEALAGALVELLEEHDERERRGEAARALVEERHTWAAVAGRVLGILGSLSPAPPLDGARRSG